MVHHLPTGAVPTGNEVVKQSHERQPQPQPKPWERPLKTSGSAHSHVGCAKALPALTVLGACCHFPIVAATP